VPETHRRYWDLTEAAWVDYESDEPQQPVAELPQFDDEDALTLTESQRD
jgi:hypothetical protein